ncbi:MAG: heterodisulfide reductase subunit B, partial [Desulfovibrio sp.]|nr:heterodisulfide reductase subunit B [Desulfovibrio sp.]
PLTGLKVVPYYGCLMNRPPDMMAFDDPENPMALDNLLLALGAEVLPFPLKVECCGASLGVTRRQIVMRLSGRILGCAEAQGAQAVVTACPMCQMNLDMRQAQVNRANQSSHRIPVFYYSQLVGLATGRDDRQIGLDRLCVSPRPALASLCGENREARS